MRTLLKIEGLHTPNVEVALVLKGVGQEIVLECLYQICSGVSNAVGSGETQLLPDSF